MISDLYREEILEHYKEPLNFGRIKKSDVHATQLNPFCGDHIEIFVKVSKNTLSDISFIGQGCAISIAGASMLTEFAKEKTLSELTKFSDEDMLSLLQIDVSETRKKCALLGLGVLRDCLTLSSSLKRGPDSRSSKE